MGVLALAHAWFHLSYTLDDAYISYRYSRNLARGMGLVYNPGEYVKGYSNTLHTLLMSVPELFGRDPNPFSKLLGLVACAVIAWSIVDLYSNAALPATRDRRLWALALLAICSPLAVHCASGLETGPYTALVFAACVRRLDEQRRDLKPWSALLLTAAVLSRPEGIVMFVALALHDACFRLRMRRFSSQDFWFYAVPPLAYGCELAWSLAYYGQPFPQTYYAKVQAAGDVMGSARAVAIGLVQQLHEGSYLTKALGGTSVARALLAAISLVWIPRARRRQNSALLCLVVAQLVFIARAGDDWAPAFRFGVPMLPALIVLLVEQLGVVVSWTGRFARASGWLAICATLWWVAPGQFAQSREVQVTRYVNGENKLNEGRLFATLTPAGSTLASFDIGGQGYGAGGLDVLDTGGLTTRETVGCRNRATERCKHYAALVLPELVRLHGNPRRDGYVGTSVVREAQYLVLDGGKYLLRRSIVLPAEFPASARSTVVPTLSGAELAAVEIPREMQVGQHRQVTLFWRRTSHLDSSFFDRRLEWQMGSTRYSAGASAVVWKLAEPRAIWREEGLFADRITLRAPHLPDRYQLEVVTDRTRFAVASVDVLTPAASHARALELINEAGAMTGEDAEQRALSVLEQAVLLHPATAREAYQGAAVRYARRRRNEIERLSTRAPIAALREAQAIKTSLHRAYWESETAGSDLRREIDANAALRQHILRNELADLH